MKLQPRLVIYTVLCLLALPAGAFAATFTVNSTVDEPDQVSTDGNCVSAPSLKCTLRAAVQQANANSGNDTIILPAGTYKLTILDNNQDESFSASGDLDGRVVNTSGESLTITGAGARTTNVVGTGDDRVLDVVDTSLTTNISGVSFSGGDAANEGGGIRASGPINLTNVAITGNHVLGTSGEGGGLWANAGGSLTNVTISGNVAEQADGTARGGGVYVNSGLFTLRNSTINGNSALPTSSQGGGLFATSSVVSHLANVTLSGNTITGAATDGAGLLGSSGLDLVNSIVALNTAAGGVPSDCGAPATSLGHNLEGATGCGFTATGDKQSSNPLLGPLQNNGGGTDTRALLAGSPAIDAGDNANCLTTDQRGTARPFNVFCDIGAFEFLPAAAPPPPPPSDDLPDPVLGKTVNVGVASGKVYYAVAAKSASIAAKPKKKAKKRKLKFKRLTKDRQLPVNAYLDTRKGTVDLTSARPTKGKTQHGLFSKSVFQVRQSRKKKAKGVTELRLYGGKSTRSCKPRKKGKKASAALSKKALRRLRSSARGRFRTRGRYGAATVRGTRWVTTDRCDGTLVQVTRGVVAVRDFRRKKTVLVKKGHRYLAKARVR